MNTNSREDIEVTSSVFVRAKEPAGLSTFSDTWTMCRASCLPEEQKLTPSRRQGLICHFGLPARDFCYTPPLLLFSSALSRLGKKLLCPVSDCVTISAQLALYLDPALGYRPLAEGVVNLQNLRILSICTPTWRPVLHRVSTAAFCRHLHWSS